METFSFAHVIELFSMGVGAKKLEDYAGDPGGAKSCFDDIGKEKVCARNRLKETCDDVNCSRNYRE